MKVGTNKCCQLRFVHSFFSRQSPSTCFVPGMGRVGATKEGRQPQPAGRFLSGGMEVAVGGGDYGVNHGGDYELNCFPPQSSYVEVLTPIPQTATSFGNRVLATGPPGKSLSLPLFSLGTCIYFCWCLCFSIFLSVNPPSFFFSLSLSPHSIPVFPLPLLVRLSRGAVLCPPTSPPSAWTSPFILWSPQNPRGFSFPASRSHFPFQPPGGSRASSSGLPPQPVPRALIGNTSRQSQHAGQLQVVIGQVTNSDL